MTEWKSVQLSPPKDKDWVLFIWKFAPIPFVAQYIASSDIDLYGRTPGTPMIEDDDGGFWDIEEHYWMPIPAFDIEEVAK